MPLTLYYHPLASYCHKVLIALYENGTAFEKRIIDLGNPRERAELQALWPPGKFPVLRDEARNRDVPESSIIIEYLDRHHAGTRPMIPADPDEALEARLWDRIFDNCVQTPMQAIVLDRILGSKGDTSAEREALKTAYAMIERRMAGRTWIASREFGLAECAAAPALFYASTLVPFAPGAANLAAYFERLMQRPSVARVIEEARPCFSMYPFAEAIPARFRGG